MLIEKDIDLLRKVKKKDNNKQGTLNRVGRSEGDILTASGHSRVQRGNQDPSSFLARIQPVKSMDSCLPHLSQLPFPLYKTLFPLPWD